MRLSQNTLVIIILFLTLTACNNDASSAVYPPDPETMFQEWSISAGRPFNHPPLPLGNQIIVVPEQGPLLALDAATGDINWQYDPPGRIWDRAYASDGEQVFVGIEGGQLVALDANGGDVRWQADLGINSQHPSLVAGDLLYVPTTFVGPGLTPEPESKAKLFILNRQDGSVEWVFESDNYILQTPFRYEDNLYVAGLFYDPEPVKEGGHTRLYALSPDGRNVKWTYEAEDGFPKGVYATNTAVTFVGYRDFITGIDAATGQQVWKKDTANWIPSLTGINDTVYFGSANTQVHALNIGSGDVEWQHNIPKGTFNYLLGAPTYVEGKLYFLTQHGDIMALDAQSGELLWQYPTGITSRVGLAVGYGRLFIGDAEGNVYAYGSE
ncbi:MAG: PQQ-binding-like beta-propeller repeat protein [Chloroflexi bacterium]|nr:PQQ-binding-like beta-propeller repeat protein [Chloroflexota bacterium]